MTTSNNINKSILGPVASPMKGTTLKVPYSGISKVSSSVSILNKLHPSKANLDSSLYFEPETDLLIISTKEFSAVEKHDLIHKATRA
jgi:hypothetical protein